VSLRVFVDADEKIAQGLGTRSRGAGTHTLRCEETALPILDHQIELIDKAIDFLQVLAASFFWFDIEGATKGNHVAQVADGVLGEVRGLGLRESCLFNMTKFSFHPSRVNIEASTEGLPENLDFFGERLSWGDIEGLSHGGRAREETLTESRSVVT
jgi:hypothetical protein